MASSASDLSIRCPVQHSGHSHLWHTLSVIGEVGQEVLAEMVGTTRLRLNFFMNKFRKLGFIDHNGARKINYKSARCDG